MIDQCKVGSIVDIANALQRAGQIMRGDVQREVQIGQPAPIVAAVEVDVRLR